MKTFWVAILMWNALNGGAEPIEKGAIVLPIAFHTEAECGQTASEIVAATLSTSKVSRIFICRPVYMAVD